MDKIAGLPTQIRQLEKRLKELDAAKVKPAVIKELTDTINNLKSLLKEKQDKREQRRKDKEQKAQEVQVEAAPAPMAPSVGATAPNDTTMTQTPGQPEATPTTPENPNAMSCPLCGGMKFADQNAYQQHMQFTHASDIMPTSPGQKLDKTVASPEPQVMPVAEPKPQEVRFKLDDEVKPIRGGDSKGRVMRWDGKDNDLVYVMWDSGPLKDRDVFGGYYPRDLESVMKPEHTSCPKCDSMTSKYGDLRSNYDALLKDLKDERDAHFQQGNSAWVARLDQKIRDLEKAIEEKFPNEKTAAGGPTVPVPVQQEMGVKPYPQIRVVQKAISDSEKPGMHKTYKAITLTLEGPMAGSDPVISRVPFTETEVRSPNRPSPNSTTWFEVFDGGAWTNVSNEVFQEQFKAYQQVRVKNGKKPLSEAEFLQKLNERVASAGAQNAEELTIMDHTPPRANTTKDEGGTDSHDEFQDEWAMPVTSATKINVLKRELLATPTDKGYDISADGKKLFNIGGKEGKPLNKKQLEFCAEIELTRGMKRAKLVEKVAFLEKDTDVFVVAEDTARKRVKFASIDQGVRGWIPASKVAFVTKKANPMRHGDHMDDVIGNGKNTCLCECPQGSGKMRWVSQAELLSSNQPPATPESLNDIESAQARVCDKCKAGHYKETEDNGAYWFTCDKCGFKMSVPKNSSQNRPFSKKADAEYKLTPDMVCQQCQRGLAVPGKDMCQDCLTEFYATHPEIRVSAKECPDCHGTFVGQEGETCPTCGRFAVQKESLKQALPPIIPNERAHVNAAKAPITMTRRKDGATVSGDYDSEADLQHDIKLYEADGWTITKVNRTEHKASLDVIARVVHREDGWHVLSEKGKNLGGPYKSEEEAVKRLRQVEYFKHHGSLKPFSKKADVLTDLTTHVTEMKDRMNSVQDKLQTVPAVKTADTSTTTTPVVQNVHPTDDDNLDVPVPAPTSPLPPGQKWVFDTQFNKYVAMPDPNAVSQQI